MTLALTQREFELAGLSDDELVRRTYALVREQLDDADNLYWLLGEAFERWAPAAEWAEHVRHARESWPDDPEVQERELKAVWEAIAERQRVRFALQARGTVDAC